MKHLPAVAVGLAPSRRLHLDQADVLAGAVGLVALLRDDALQPEFERGRQKVLRIIEGLGEAQQVRVGAGEQSLKGARRSGTIVYGRALALYSPHEDVVSCVEF